MNLLHELETLNFAKENGSRTAKEVKQEIELLLILCADKG